MKYTQKTLKGNHVCKDKFLESLYISLDIIYIIYI